MSNENPTDHEKNRGGGFSGNGSSMMGRTPPSGNGNLFEDEGDHLSLQDYIQIIMRRKWIVIAAFLSVFISTVIFTLRTTPTYQAKSTVLVDTKGQKGNGLFLFDPVGMSYAKNLNNELEILKSRTLAGAVAEKLLDMKYHDARRTEKITIVSASPEDEEGREFVSHSEVIGRLLSAVEFEPVRDSDVINITAKNSNPKDAALIANMYAEAYYERNLRSSRTKSRAARVFLENQLEIRKKELRQAENALQQYMEKNKVVSLDEEANSIIEQLSTLEAQYDQVDIDIQSIDESLKFYEEQVIKQEPNVAKVMGEASDPYIRLLQEELARKEVERDVVVVQNPDKVGQDLYMSTIQELDTQIEVLREKLQRRTNDYLKSMMPGQGADPAKYLLEVKQKVFELQINKQALQSRKKALAEVIAQYQRQFDTIPETSIQFARLQRTRLSAEKLYLLVEEKYQEATIAEQSEFGYIEIIDQAVVPHTPVSPKTRLNFMLGALIGLGLGVGLVFLLEYIDVSIRTPEDLKRKGYHALSIISSMDSEVKPGRTNVSDEQAVDNHLLAYLNPRASVAEAYRRLRTNIQYTNIDNPIKTLVVTSPNPKEGKSTTAANLAITFAQAGKKTLLIDTDLRRPSVHRQFGLHKEPGLVNYLFEKNSYEEIRNPFIIENLEVITCGIIPPNPAEILSSNAMANFTNHVKGLYDIVIFDSPPVLAVTDASILGNATDGTLLMVSAGSTMYDELTHSVEQLERVNAKVLGVALNNFDLKRAYGGYYGYYRYKSRYYGYYSYHSQTAQESEEKEKN